MIATISGNISEKIGDILVVEAGGIGYGLAVNADDYAKSTVGNEAKFYVYEHIREQSHDLFGFTSLATKSLFEQLLGVKNVGPKVAMAILSIGSENYVKSAIANGDIKILQSAKGVGKRAAEQIVVELRDKVGLVSSDDAEAIVGRTGVGARDEAMQALIALGYSDADAQRSLSQIDDSLSTEERIKLALRGGV